MSNTQKIAINEIKIGMYVHSLDRPWLETPFLLQGFLLETEQDIITLSEYCEFVYINPTLSVKVAEGSSHSLSSPAKKKVKDIFAGKKLDLYTDKSNWRDEFPKARAALHSLSECVKGILSCTDKNNTFDMVKVKQAVEPMINSISRNPDACIWLARMKAKDDYSYNHSLGCSIWSVALGRQLGLPKSDLRSLAIGGLLLDVGKLQVNQDLLFSKRRLSAEEFEQIKPHVVLGVESLKNSGVINQDVLDMAAYHHERHDGSGYPNGIGGDEIPVFARIAAIVDCYDAITSHRHYATALSPSRAIKELYDSKGVDFQAELVEEFIQAVGIYPAGTLVELSSGEVAIVVAEYRSRRLRPQVMVLLDQNKAPITESVLIDLMTKTQTDDGKPLEIVDSLEAESYGIDMTAIEL